MSGDPFIGGEAGRLVVANAGRQYALWRPYPDVPKGRRVVCSCPDRDGALGYAERNLTAAVETPTT
ncbi:MbtH family NRPS accessory protein [Streptomyces sp. HK10]|uniref:MbtH family NRPS accessory protein n=1 Tax=Streptomyces sp. HK10 TaxID=3373255 RepID=UPI00374A6893